MRHHIVLPFILLLIAAVNGFSQAPIPDADTVGTPIQQGDPTLESMPPGLDYVEDKKRITPEELPDPVRETLESGTSYKNWKEGNLFHDRNTDEYIVEHRDAGKTTTYRFTKEGKPIIQKE